jgi:hypothetical protein
MKEATMSEVAVLGIDLGKTSWTPRSTRCGAASASRIAASGYDAPLLMGPDGHFEKPRGWRAELIH